jgi:hypothetical protein
MTSDWDFLKMNAQQSIVFRIGEDRQPDILCFRGFSTMAYRHFFNRNGVAATIVSGSTVCVTALVSITFLIISRSKFCVYLSCLTHNVICIRMNYHISFYKIKTTMEMLTRQIISSRHCCAQQFATITPSPKQSTAF